MYYPTYDCIVHVRPDLVLTDWFPLHKLDNVAYFARNTTTGLVAKMWPSRNMHGVATDQCFYGNWDVMMKVASLYSNPTQIKVTQPEVLLHHHLKAQNVPVVNVDVKLDLIHPQTLRQLLAKWREFEIGRSVVCDPATQLILGILTLLLASVLHCTRSHLRKISLNLSFKT